MKYIYFLIIPIILFVGCTSSESKKMDQDISNLKKSLDSLKKQSQMNDKTLDSLNKETLRKEEQMLRYQQMLDSLKKNLQEE